jgi:hypothetical protein
MVHVEVRRTIFKGLLKCSCATPSLQLAQNQALVWAVAVKAARSRGRFST